MKLFNFIFVWLLIFSSITFAAKIGDDELKIGKSGSAADKIIKLGEDRLIRSNESTGNLEFSNDTGSLWKKIGSGTGAGGAGGVNILSNASFEDGLTNWTNSGGTLTQETYTNGLDGNTKYARFVATGAGQYVETDLTTFHDNLSGGGMGDFKYLQGDNAFVYKVINGSAGVISSGDISDLTSWLKAPTITFDIPSQAKLRIESTGAGTIDFDEAYLGSNKNISPVGKGSYFVGSITYPAQSIDALNSSTSWTSLSFASLPLSITTIGDVALVNSGQDVAITIPNAKKGTYVINLHGELFQTNSGDNVGSWRVHDGTASYQESIEGVINVEAYTYFGDKTFSIPVTSDGSITFAIQNKSNTGSVGAVRLSTAGAKISVQYYPSGSETVEAFTPEQADFFISGSIGGGNASLLNSASETPIESSSLSMILKDGIATIPCSGTNLSTGLTCSVGNESVGVVFNAPLSGVYEICMRALADGASAHGVRIVETENAAQTILNTSTQMAYLSQDQWFSICAPMDVNSSGKKTFRLFSKGSTASVFVMDRAAAVWGRELAFTVKLLSHNVSRPIIQNMVDTSVGSGVRHDGCRVNESGSTYSFDLASGMCDSWFASLSNNGSGDIDLVFINSGDYSCSVSGASPTRSIAIQYPDNTKINILSSRTSDQVPSDQAFSVLCSKKR